MNKQEVQSIINQIYRSAIQYADLGWRCFPIWSVTNHGKCCCGSKHCQSPGKHPHSFAPHGFTQATTDKSILSRWFKDHRLNLGIATGESSGIVVLDVDAKNGGIESLNALQRTHGAFPKTPTVRTGGGGYHYIFKFPKDSYGRYSSDIRNSAGKVGKGLDIRANGGYIVAAPSLHTSGKQYEWVVAADTDIADIPKWVLKLITQIQPSKAIMKSDTIIPIGERDNTLMSIAGYLRRTGLEEDEILPTLLKINENRCAEPLSDTQVEKIARSVVRYEPEASLPTRQRRSMPEASPLCNIPSKLMGIEVERTFDMSKFKPMYAEDLAKVLDITVKKDNNNKVITALCMLSAYTYDNQSSLIFNAPSSTGKTYIPIEVSYVFPREDTIKVGYCSPTAFFHDEAKFDEESGKHIIDLSHKILIFIDQPHNQLLERLRPVLSHDEREIEIKITDRSQKHGLRTKNVTLRGYPVVCHCTAGLRVDEQEATRSFLLSPDTDQIKYSESLQEKMLKDAKGTKAYLQKINSNPERLLLKDRIQAIKQAGIQGIIIHDLSVVKRFTENKKFLQPRHTRDLGRLNSLIKSLALLNLWWRERDGDTIITKDIDVEEGFKIWNSISESQERGLPPYVIKLYYDIVQPAFEDNKECGLTRSHIIKKHFSKYNRPLSKRKLNDEIIPMLEMAGFVRSERDEDDRRRWLIYAELPRRGGECPKRTCKAAKINKTTTPKVTGKGESLHKPSALLEHISANGGSLEVHDPVVVDAKRTGGLHPSSYADSKESHIK